MPGRFCERCGGRSVSKRTTARHAGQPRLGLPSSLFASRSRAGRCPRYPRRRLCPHRHRCTRLPRRRPVGRYPQTVPVTTGWASPPPRRRKRGKGRLVLLTLVVVALVGVALAVGDPAGPATADADPGRGNRRPDRRAPDHHAGPNLGDAWTTAPDPANFIALEGGDQVAADQYLVMFGDGTTASGAEAAAKAIDGTIIGHFAYLDTWKIGTAYAAADAETWHNQRAILERQPGVVVVSRSG